MYEYILIYEHSIKVHCGIYQYVPVQRGTTRYIASMGCYTALQDAILHCFNCPDPALADTLVPDSFSLSNGNHPTAPPAVAPRPDVHLVESAAVAPISLRVS